MAGKSRKKAQGPAAITVSGRDMPLAHASRHSHPPFSRSARVPDPMRRVTWLARRLMLALALTLAAAPPAAAQSILRDSETEKLFADMSKPLIEAAQLDPKNVKI